jgi:hypothetical protein
VFRIEPGTSVTSTLGGRIEGRQRLARGNLRAGSIVFDYNGRAGVWPTGNLKYPENV